jgi:hypothetical protein
MLFEALAVGSLLVVALKPSEVRRLGRTAGFHAGRIAGSLAAAQERFASAAGQSEVRQLQREIGEASDTVRRQFSSGFAGPLLPLQHTSAGASPSPASATATSISAQSAQPSSSEPSSQQSPSKIPVSAREVGRSWRTDAERQSTSALGKMEDVPSGADVLMDALAESAVAHEASTWLKRQQPESATG